MQVQAEPYGEGGAGDGYYGYYFDEIEMVPQRDIEVEDHFTEVD